MAYIGLSRQIASTIFEEEIAEQHPQQYAGVTAKIEELLDLNTYDDTTRLDLEIILTLHRQNPFMPQKLLARVETVYENITRFRPRE